MIDPTLLSLMQLIASSLIAVCSLVVAAVACLVAYRQAYGYSPILLLRELGLAGSAEMPEHYMARMNFDVWNRRKYAIKIEAVTIVFFELRFDEFAPNFRKVAGQYFTEPGTIRVRPEKVVDPGVKWELDIEAPFKRRSLDDLNDEVRVKLSYFDPLANRSVTEVLASKYVLNPMMAGVKRVEYG